MDLLIIALAAATFFIGGLWYSPLLFLNPWTKEIKAWSKKAANFPKKEGEKHPAVVFGTAYALSFIAALGMAYLMRDSFQAPKSALGGMGLGAIVGACFAGTTLGINYAFVGKSLKLLLIDAGYHIVQFSLVGLVLGLAG